MLVEFLDHTINCEMNYFLNSWVFYLGFSNFFFFSRISCPTKSQFQDTKKNINNKSFHHLEEKNINYQKLLNIRIQFFNQNGTGFPLIQIQFRLIFYYSYVPILINTIIMFHWFYSLLDFAAWVGLVANVNYTL